MSDDHEVRLSMSPKTPLKRGKRISSTKSAWRFRYSTAPTTRSLSGIEIWEDEVEGLTELDARVNLGKLIHKKKRGYLHVVIQKEKIR